MLEHRFEDLAKGDASGHAGAGGATATQQPDIEQQPPGRRDPHAGDHDDLQHPEPHPDSERLQPRRGRRAPIAGISEADAEHALNHFCAHVGESLSGHHTAHSARLKEDCTALLSHEAAVALEEHAFEEGGRGLRLRWCVEIAGVCSAHEVIDSGEL